MGTAIPKKPGSVLDSILPPPIQILPPVVVMVFPDIEIPPPFVASASELSVTAPPAVVITELGFNTTF